MFRDFVRVADKGFIALRSRLGAWIAGHSWDFDDNKSVVEIQGWVKLLMRERGKVVPGSHREGHNIWTNTGREYLAMLMSIEDSSAPTVAFRKDQVAYIGVGTGSQTEDAGVTSVVTPVAYSGSDWLAALDMPPSFPLSPTRTSVRYTRIFTESQITTTPASYEDISEMGLFTNGSPLSTPIYDPDTELRDLTLANAASQAPVAYKSFEPVRKTDAMQLEISWEIRF